MTAQSSNLTPEHKSYLGLLLFPIALFPFVALLTYDSRVVTSYPPLPSTNWIGALGDHFAYYGYMLFGLAIWIVPLLCIIAGICLILGRKMNSIRRASWLLAIVIALSSLIQVAGNYGAGIKAASEAINIANPGGAIGYLLMTKCLSPLLSDFGSSVIMTSFLLIAIVAAIGAHNLLNFFLAIYHWAILGKYLKNVEHNEAPAWRKEEQTINASDAYDPIKAAYEAKAAAQAQLKAEKEEARARRLAEREQARALKLAEKEALKAAKEAEKEAAAEKKVVARANDKPTPSHEEGNKDELGPYILPDVSLLSPLKKQAADHGDVGEMSKKLIDTLKLFGVDATIAYTIQGPVVTKYAVQLEPGTMYSAVTKIEKNLMGALHARSLRIEAPIPGEENVGIEVPNRTAIGISFREIFESEAWKKANQKWALPLLFGKDAAGNDLVADLATMPHMLVAGATGQGKSVCLNALINGLLMTRTPEQLRFIMVDPKSVEFASYASIPHLLVPVITDNNKVVGALNWAVVEMEKRLKMFARAKVRNIADFNNRPQFTQVDMFGADTEVASDMPKTVPYIVIIIDEVADLMQAAAKQVEPGIARLTAKARAAGIHLILATQRPDAKVITGTIKANIPGRVAFKTATGIDSRTILDATGAENLIGRGDMLFKTKEGLLIRAQGAWIQDIEIERITSFIEQHAVQKFDDSFTKKLAKIKEASLEDEDEEESEEEAAAQKQAQREQVKADENASDFKKAIECIINTNRASTSHFQRKLGWGYNHSAKIMDMLEEAGIIGPQVGAGPRQITMDQQQLLAMFNGTAENAAEQIGDDALEQDLFTSEEQ
ncbi:MAG: DNA translocase FtsK [Kiritimatiellae bacterium]|nr:DNA translocase FtsK [Kiritimatiellia bacterium]